MQRVVSSKTTDANEVSVSNDIYEQPPTSDSRLNAEPLSPQASRPMTEQNRRLASCNGIKQSTELASSLSAEHRNGRKPSRFTLCNGLDTRYRQTCKMNRNKTSKLWLPGGMSCQWVPDSVEECHVNGSRVLWPLSLKIGHLHPNLAILYKNHASLHHFCNAIAIGSKLSPCIRQR